MDKRPTLPGEHEEKPNGQIGTGKSSDESKLLGKEGQSMKKTDVFFRADQIDLKNLDRHLSKAWTREIETRRQKEEWEIDLGKLDMRGVIAHGTFGTVYRGVYDGQDVAGPMLWNISMGFEV